MPPELIAAVTAGNARTAPIIITGFADVAGLAELPSNIQVLHKPFRRAQFIAALDAMLGRTAGSSVARAVAAGDGFGLSRDAQTSAAP